MINLRMLKSQILLLALSGFLFAACTPASTPPGPDMAAGVYIQSGYEFYRWEEGLTLMIWFDGAQSSACSSSSSTNDPQFVLQCHAVSRSDVRFDWHLETEDGLTADFSIDGQSFDLDDGKLFLISTSSGEAEVTQIERDLSGVRPEADSITEFSLDDPVIQGFIHDSSETELAFRALTAFFSRLHAGGYEQAAALYGGTYDVMIDHNPEIDPDDHAALFRNACTINGAQCLEIGSVVLEEQSALTEFKFAVEFKNDDGSLFELGPCCGATETDQPPQSVFVYTVKKSMADEYVVLEMPVYTP
ncbi:MAG: hypothetical protein AMJ88_05205 [Anaerolineae bacterium SM23_ 63]|nr:MAG: hypothetical protein AMJ88_05205 [Anaerolineae bacterium SM23_ 63]HEY48332.1 hypothetical protein [Anaerolineae bacterium]